MTDRSVTKQQHPVPDETLERSKPTGMPPERVWVWQRSDHYWEVAFVQPQGFDTVEYRRVS